MLQQLLNAEAAADAAAVRFIETSAALLGALQRREGAALPAVLSAARLFERMAELQRIRLRKAALLAVLARLKKAAFAADNPLSPFADAQLERRLSAAVRKARLAIVRSGGLPLPPSSFWEDLAGYFTAKRALFDPPLSRTPAPPWFAREITAFHVRPPIRRR